MNKLRQLLIATLIVGFPAFFVYVGLDVWSFSSAPTAPNGVTGQVYPWQTKGRVHYLTKVEFNTIGTTEILVFVTWPLLFILGSIYNRRKKRAEEKKLRADLMREHGS